MHVLGISASMIAVVKVTATETTSGVTETTSGVTETTSGFTETPSGVHVFLCNPPRTGMKTKADANVIGRATVLELQHQLCKQSCQVSVMPSISHAKYQSCQVTVTPSMSHHQLPDYVYRQRHKLKRGS